MRHWSLRVLVDIHPYLACLATGSLDRRAESENVLGVFERECLDDIYLFDLVGGGVLARHDEHVLVGVIHVAVILDKIFTNHCHLLC